MATRDDLSERQLARRKTRAAGDRSARLARELMEVAEWMLGKLELDPGLLAAITSARAVTSLGARRRAERTLAGDLRRADLKTIAVRLARVRATGTIASERLQVAERWRTRLLDEGEPAIAAFTGPEPDHALPGLVAQAQRERATGKPPGAGRALFRHLVEVLKTRGAPDAGADPDASADDDADDDT